MMNKEELKAQMVKEAIANAEKKADEEFERLNKKRQEREEVLAFAKTFPLITSRKWWEGIDDGMHTYFYKDMGFADTDGEPVRLAFYLMFWASEERVYIEADTYSKHQNESCGYIGQVLHNYGNIQPSYDEEGNEGMLPHLYSFFPDMKPLEDECNRMLKEVENWSEDRLEILDDVLNELCRVEHYEKEK